MARFPASSETVFRFRECSGPSQLIDGPLRFVDTDVGGIKCSAGSNTDRYFDWDET